ncbi:DNA polymerase [Candidatus Woesearchaeota archaeon]|nr:DNA polymerase [Candidatus Woesearchaeota archaeon]
MVEYAPTTPLESYDSLRVIIFSVTFYKGSLSRTFINSFLYLMLMEKIGFYLMDITYKIEENKPVLYLFGKTREGKQVCVLDRNVEPYFYVLLKDEDNIKNFIEKIVKIETEEKDRTAKVTRAEETEKKFLGKKRKAVKVYVQIPPDVPVIREIIKDWDMIETVLEYDIPFRRRYLLDKKITPMMLVEAEGEFINIRSKVPVLDAEKISTDEDSIKEPDIIGFDIETYNPEGKRFKPEEHPIIMLAFYGKDYKKIITWKRFKTEDKDIEFVDGEVDLLNRFKEVLKKEKPDILTGYNSDGFDLPYIITRARKYDIDMDIGLDYSTLKYRKGRSEQILITGIVHLDVFKFIKKSFGRSLETYSYSLDSVAAELLGEKKDDVDMDTLAGSWDSNKGLEVFCRYNLKDAMLAYKLCKEVLPNIEEFVKIIGLPIYDINRMGFSQMVEWYILKQAQEHGELAPNKPHHDDIKERMGKRYKGGFVFEPKPGLYSNIAVFDFRSLYPTIISSHNIGLSTLDCSCCRDSSEKVPGEDYWFCKKKKGFLPSLVNDLIERRARVKEILKEKEDRMLEARSNSLKVLANSFYGYLGFYAARWYCMECAKSVTAYGRYYINKVIKQAKKNGFDVIYSDTDSIFLALEDEKEEKAKNFVEKLNQDLPGIMELEYEQFYPSGIFVGVKQGAFGAKKKYALLSKEGSLKITGFETVRRNWSLVAKETQEKILNIILKEKDKEKAVNYARSVIRDIEEKKIENEKMIINTQLQKEVEEYASVAPHVEIAKRMKEKGVDVGPGSMIQFIVSNKQGIIREKARIPSEVEKGDYDAEYYIHNQVVPAVAKIFEVLGYDKEDLFEKDQSQLGDFF